MVAVRFAFVALLAFCAPISAHAYSDAEFQRLVSSPDDPVLNRQFAAAAEARGELRHALAAIERALSAHPDDRSLIAEYERIRRKMLPAATAITVQIGGTYASDPRQVNGGSALKRGDGILDSAITLEDERTLAGVRIRSFALAAGQWNRNTSEISSGRLSFESGPVFTLSRDTWLHVAPGGSVAWLDGQQLYSEGSIAATVGGVFRGLTQTLTARYGWRQGNDHIDYSDSEVLEILARLVVSPSIISGDYLYLEPRYRLGTPKNNLPDSLVLPTVLGPSTLVSRDISPPGYEEWGARVSYFWPVGLGNAYFGAGISVYERDFDGFVLDPAALAAGVQVATDRRRNDLYIEPTAHMIFPDLIAPHVDLRADYRLEDNFSNDSYRDYLDHVLGLRVVGRF